MKPSPRMLTPAAGWRICSIRERHSIYFFSAEHLAAITFVCMEGYSYQEAAPVLDLPWATVASRIERARAMVGRFQTHGRKQSLQATKAQKHKG